MSLAQAFEIQARACAALDSPFMERLLLLLARRWPDHGGLARLCADWPGDIGPHGASLPLRIAGGLHALVLTGRDTGLAAVYPPQECDDSDLTDAVLRALARHDDFMLRWMQSPPQTNEVRRSATLIAAGHWLAARHPLPFEVSELGASAGLNLMWDHYALTVRGRRLGPADPVLTLTPDWDGPVPGRAPVTLVDRRGVDLNPVNPHDPDDALRLFAYLWPDQPHRMTLTRAAVAAATAPVDTGSAADWLFRRLDQTVPGHLHMIFHTIAWQYFPAEEQARARALIEDTGAKSTADTPLAWVGMESDGQPDGAALTARLWPGDHRVTLGRADFHGRWIRWDVA